MIICLELSLSLSFPLLFALIWNFFRLPFLLPFSIPPPSLSIVKFVFFKKKKKLNLAWRRSGCMKADLLNVLFEKKAQLTLRPSLPSPRDSVLPMTGRDEPFISRERKVEFSKVWFTVMAIEFARVSWKLSGLPGSGFRLRNYLSWWMWLHFQTPSLIWGGGGADWGLFWGVEGLETYSSSKSQRESARVH